MRNLRAELKVETKAARARRNIRGGSGDQGSDRQKNIGALQLLANVEQAQFVQTAHGK